MTLSTVPPNGGAQIPVWSTVGDVYRTTWRLRGRLVAVAAWPMSLNIAAFMLVAAAARLEPGTPWVPLARLADALIWTAAYALFAVAWHREVLLRSGAERSTPASWNRRHTRFAILLWLMFAIVISPLAVHMSTSLLFSGDFLLWSPMLWIVGNGVHVAAFFVMIPVSWYLVGRFSFVLPATAVDEQYGLHDSWRNTRRNGWRLAAILFFTFVAPFFVGVVAMAAFFGASDLSLSIAITLTGLEPEIHPATAPDQASALPVVSELFGFVLSYIEAALMIAAVSLSFHRATGWVPAND